jgi:hypothetical protein
MPKYYIPIIKWERPIQITSSQYQAVKQALLTNPNTTFWKQEDTWEDVKGSVIGISIGVFIGLKLELKLCTLVHFALASKNLTLEDGTKSAS